MSSIVQIGPPNLRSPAASLASEVNQPHVDRIACYRIVSATVSKGAIYEGPSDHLNAHPEAFKQLDLFLDLARRKKFRAVSDRTFPLAEARAAQRYLEGRDHFGKVMLTMVR